MWRKITRRYDMSNLVDNIKGVEHPKTVTTVDVTPTWGEIGRIYENLAKTSEHKALEPLHREKSRAFAMAQGLSVIWGTLTPGQQKLANDAMEDDMRVQGYE
jgi:hypothetical protein